MKLAIILSAAAAMAAPVLNKSDARHVDNEGTVTDGLPDGYFYRAPDHYLPNIGIEQRDPRRVYGAGVFRARERRGLSEREGAEADALYQLGVLKLASRDERGGSPESDEPLYAVGVLKLATRKDRDQQGAENRDAGASAEDQADPEVLYRHSDLESLGTMKKRDADEADNLKHVARGAGEPEAHVFPSFRANE